MQYFKTMALKRCKITERHGKVCQYLILNSQGYACIAQYNIGIKLLISHANIHVFLPITARNGKIPCFLPILWPSIA